MVEARTRWRQGPARTPGERGAPAAETPLAPERESCLRAYRWVRLSRSLDEAGLRLRRQRKSYFQLGIAGHEIVQAACALFLWPGVDWLYPYYRDQALVLGCGVEPRDILRQYLGKATDPSGGGRQMPGHFGHARWNVVSQSSPTGTQFPQAVGTAEAGRIARFLPPSSARPSFTEGELVYVSGGEGATSQGEFWEAVNAAVVRELPVLFLIEDNEYAISVPVEDQTAGGSVSRALSGMPGLHVEEVDGLDFLRSWQVLRRVVARVRSGRGPALVHAHVLRLVPHSDSDDDSLYRASVERDEAHRRDPLPGFEAWLVEQGISSGELETMREEIDSEVRRLADEVDAEPDPEASTVEEHLWAPGASFVRERDEGPAPPAVPGDEDEPGLTIVEGINRCLSEELTRDPRVLLFGEDVADVSRADHIEEVAGKGGVFKVTRGLQRRFGPERVFNTALAEASIVGRALGLAVRGFRPVVEIQFLDFIWPAMNQIRSELSVLRWRSAGAFSAPVVIRAPSGGYLTGGALYHSQSAESVFCSFPGLRVALPSNARDAVGLLRSAMRCGDPVLFLEHKHLYRQARARRPWPGADWSVPLGCAATVREGRDVTVVTYGALVETCLRAASELETEGFDAHVIDLRWLRPYDWEAIRTSVQCTGRLLVVHEEARDFGFGGEIAARAAEELFEYLDAPVGRLGGRGTPVGYSPVLERAALPAPEQVVEALRRTARY